MSGTNDRSGTNTKAWLLVICIAFCAIIALRFSVPKVQPQPNVLVSANPPEAHAIYGRWVDTNFDGSAFDLSPLGKVTVTSRGVRFPTYGNYKYANGDLKFTLDGFTDVRDFEMKVLSADQNAMVIYFRPLIYLGKMEQTTLWRIDAENYAPLRAKLIGRWALDDESGLFLDFLADDGFKRRFRGETDPGIFRVVDDKLEYSLRSQQPSVMKFQIKSVDDEELILLSETQNKEFRYLKKEQ